MAKNKVFKLTKSCELYAKALKAEEYNADGFGTQEDLLNGMHKYYPKIDYASPVTVIKWDNIRGKLVDEYKSRKVPSEMCNSP